MLQPTLPCFVQLADTAPETVKRVVDAELMHPIELFLTAYDSAKVGQWHD